MLASLQQTSSQTSFSDGTHNIVIQPLPASHLLLASSFNSKLYGCIHTGMMNLTWHFQNACVWRAATAMRRASNRVPKRSLDTDFELSQVEPHQKGRAGARRGPVGPSKVRKAAFTSTGTVIPQGMGHSRFCLSAAAAETLCPSTSPKGQAC